ncbi:MAG TPA: ArgE/DapE family deacylase [Pyrodictium sp.]|nr:ArgE/DapE family deacylase [Pyrodictium sp.]
MGVRLLDLKEIFERIDQDFEWAIKILKETISIPTINPPGEHYEEFKDYIVEVLRDIGMDVHVYKVPKDYVSAYYPDYANKTRYIVVARVGRGRPVLQFNGHYDVVPPGSGWSQDPFKPYVDNGKLYGRGAVDMKGGIAATLLAVKTIISLLDEPQNGSLEIALVPDEEIGGKTGTGYLVEHIGVPDYTIIAEPSNANSVWIGHKGALWGFIEVYGKQAHGSTPWHGVNAFEYMARIALDMIKEYASKLDNRRSAYDYGDPRAAKPTINLGGEVVGGAKINIVPGYYAFSFDRRLIVEEKLEEVEKEIGEVVERISAKYEREGVKIKLKIVSRLPPALTSPDNVLVKTIINIGKNLGLNIKPIICVGGLDLHYYTTKGGVAVAYGPGPTELAHQANEYVSLEELRTVAKVYAGLIKTLIY